MDKFALSNYSTLQLVSAFFIHQDQDQGKYNKKIITAVGNVNANLSTYEKEILNEVYVKYLIKVRGDGDDLTFKIDLLKRGHTSLTISQNDDGDVTIFQLDRNESSENKVLERIELGHFHPTEGVNENEFKSRRSEIVFMFDNDHSILDVWSAEEIITSFNLMQDNKKPEFLRKLICHLDQTVSSWEKNYPDIILKLDKIFTTSHCRDHADIEKWYELKVKTLQDQKK